MSEFNSPRPWLTPAQHRLTALAATSLAVMILIGVIFLAVWALQAFIATFGTVIWPLAIAGILAMLLRPLVNRIEQRLLLSRVQAIVLLYVLVIAACAIIGAALLPLIISETIEFVRFALPDFITNAHHHLNQILAQYPDIYQSLKTHLDEKMLQNDTQATTQRFFNLLLSAPSTLRKIFEIAAALAVIPIYLFFLLETHRNLVRDLHAQLTFLPAQHRKDLVFLVQEFAGIMLAFFQGRLLIGLIMAVLMAVGFTLIGLKGGFILGLIFGFLNIVPYLGAILGVVFILPIAYFQGAGGDWVLLLEALGVFSFVQIGEAYYITPKIMGERTGLHPMVIIFSIFFWGQALHGFLGIILGVPLTAFLVVFWRLLKTKYLPSHGLTSPGFKINPPE